MLRSRLGFTGTKDFGSGYGAAFTLETGFNATNGTQADQPNATATGLTTSGRLFDRQAWAGLTSTNYGEFRVGRQNTDIQSQGNYIDYTERNLGSVVNSFGVPSRYDGDIAYLSPRIAGVQVVAHYAIGGGGQQNTSTFNQGVYQLRADWVGGPDPRRLFGPGGQGAQRRRARQRRSTITAPTRTTTGARARSTRPTSTRTTAAAR